MRDVREGEALYTHFVVHSFIYSCNISTVTIDLK